VKEFYTPSEAARWLSAQTGENLSEPDVLELAADGRLPVCFAYRGQLGYFLAPATFPTDSELTRLQAPKRLTQYAFDGYLKSLLPCALAVELTEGGITRTEDLLRPRQVTIAKTVSGR
jgi:hypothetical protein